MKVTGLFAGIAGIELGLNREGFETVLLCENDPAALAVLKSEFRDKAPIHEDVADLGELPEGTELLTAGFPCQDLSQAGSTAGIKGLRSGLVSHVFRLLDEKPVPWVLVENVPFMLQLDRGSAMDFLVTQFEERGYRWAYRVVDSRAFGLPQRRRRVYFVASTMAAPEELIFAEDAGTPERPTHAGRACGFYWTEGSRGLGWAVDSVPTLKGGSSVGIPSPPAIWMPDGRIVKPDLRDAERLQGFEVDWTRPAEAVRASLRWKLVGNAVTVDAAAWVGRTIKHGSSTHPPPAEPFMGGKSWPTAAYGSKAGRWSVGVSEWPVRKPMTALEDFLQYEPIPLSQRATSGFMGRLFESNLRYPDEFGEALEQHLNRMSGASITG